MQDQFISDIRNVDTFIKSVHLFAEIKKVAFWVALNMNFLFLMENK